MRMPKPTPSTILDAIYSRRSVRHFTRQQVGKETIEALLDAAVQAPSALNLQPWAFIVIQNPGLLRCISTEAKELLKREKQDWHADIVRFKTPVSDPNFDIFYGASTLITICAEKEGFQPLGDCYLAAENLMLAAQAFGLATCPIGLARDILQTDAYQKELQVPSGYEVVLPIAVGYTNGIAAKTPRNQARLLSWKK